MRTVALVLLLATALSLPAHAAQCDLDASSGAVSASGRQVSIGGQMFPVKGGAARSYFEAKLLSCNMPEAAQRFRQWRNSRRAVNWEVGLGLLVTWPALVGIPISGINASTRKHQMIEAIRAGR